jgi:DNA helicase HerA-like ATPase
MSDNDQIFIGQAFDSGDSTPAQTLRLDRANRHGLITGATGTGKTVTLQGLAESFARAGVPVFAADVKGDLAGISQPGAGGDKIISRAQSMGIDWKAEAAPASFWDVMAQSGVPVRATLSEMGPLMLTRLLELSDAQEGVLNVVFQVADEQGLLLLDLDDLGALLTYVGENAREIGLKYGNVAPASVSTVQRKILSLKNQGAAGFFGEPALRLEDLMRTSLDGRGYVNVLAADQLINAPQVYATFLLWLLSELFEALPEVGDPPKPRLVFFFDEAHLLFTDAPKPLLQKIEQVVRLIRSKGVSVWFITQSPADVPETVLAQLGTRVQHALRAYTPNEQTALQIASRSFRANPAFDTAQAIQGLGVGEALVSTLDEKGAPTMVAKTRIRPPNSRIGPITPDERRAVIAASPVATAYSTPVNRESAFELLKARATQTATAPVAPKVAPAPRASTRAGPVEAMMTSMVRAAGSQLGRALIRGVLGSLTRR